MIATFLQLLVSGLLMGCIYSMISIGLTLVWGVMDLTNFAHMQFVMLGMYGAFWLYTLIKLDPLVSLPLVSLGFVVLGYLVYRITIQPIMAPSLEFERILTTFALGSVLANGAMLMWTPNFRVIPEVVSTGSIPVGDIIVSVPRLVAAAASILATIGMHLFLTRTRTGRALMAVSMNRDAAAIVGINVQRMFSLAYALGIAFAGAAGVLLMNFMYVYPNVGTIFILIAFAAITIGGLGSMVGTLIGGIIVGLLESFGGYLIGPSLKYSIVFLAFLIILIWKPKGLLGQW